MPEAKRRGAAPALESGEQAVWRMPLLVLGAGAVALAVLFHDTIASAVTLWWTRSSYNHCFLILPISGYLVWEKRAALAKLAPSPSVLGIALLAAAILFWILSRAVDIVEAEHVAFVGMMQALVLGILGWQVFRTLIFPMTYLWLLVPTGTALVPILQDLATAQSTWLIGLAGLPIYVEGYSVQVPSGLYYIAPGCAGLNFVLASLALGPLYAYLVYERPWKRAAGVLALLGLSVVANAVRIAAIILVAHYTGRRFGIVDDHLLYGWGFFALVLVAAGALGLRFADPVRREAGGAEGVAGPRAPAGRIGIPRFVAAGAAALAILFAGPWALGRLGDAAPVAGKVVLALDGLAPGRAEGGPGWAPVFPGAHLREAARFPATQGIVDVFVAYYWGQPPGRELVSFSNKVEGGWERVGRGTRTVIVDGRRMTVSETRISRNRTRRLVWSWYWIAGRMTQNPLAAKLLELRARAFGNDERAALVAVSTEEGTTPGAAEARLERFLAAASSFDALLARARLEARAATED